MDWLLIVVLISMNMCVCVQGRIQDFSKGGQGNGYMYKLYYIHIAIIHIIIILNEVHCNLLKAIDA